MLYTCRYRKDGTEGKLSTLMIVRNSEKEVLDYINGKGWFHVDTHPCPYPFADSEDTKTLPVIKDDGSKQKISELEKEVKELKMQLETKPVEIISKDDFDINEIIDNLDGRRSYRPSELKKIIAEGVENA